MKYIEATTIHNPIKENIPVVINATGKRLVIRADIEVKNADITIIAKEIFIDSSRIVAYRTDYNSKDYNKLMVVELIAKEQIHIMGSHIFPIPRMICEGRKPENGYPFMQILRTDLPTRVENFYHFNAQKTALNIELKSHIHNCSDSGSKIFKITFYGYAAIFKKEYYLATKEFTEAIELATFSKSIITAYDLATIFFARGLAHEGNENFEEAMWDFNKAIKINNNIDLAKIHLKNATENFKLNFESFKLQGLSLSKSAAQEDVVSALGDTQDTQENL